MLRLLENDKVLICGIATEFCVRNTAQDLAAAGFKVTVLKDCLAYVDPQGHKDALKALKAQGIRVV